MKLPDVLANSDHKYPKIALVATLLIAALFLFAQTSFGTRAISQLGIGASVAQTVGAAQIALQKTGDALNSFIGRSPGERGATDILKGKAKRTALRDAKVGDTPAQRALGKVFDNPVKGITEPAVLPPVVAFLPDGTTVASGPAAALVPVGPAILPPILGGGPGGGGIIIGGGGGGPGGGGGGGGGTVVVPPVVPVIPSAVPEPSTWLLLLLGFGMIGASLRRTGSSGSFGSKRAGRCVSDS